MVCRNAHCQHLFWWLGFLLLTAFKWCLYSNKHQYGSPFNLFVFGHCTHFRDGHFLPPHFTLLDSDLSVFWTVGPHSKQVPWRACHMVSCGFRVSHRVVLLFHHIIRERWVVMNIHGVLVIQPVIRRWQMSRREANVGETKPSQLRHHMLVFLSLFYWSLWLPTVHFLFFKFLFWYQGDV